MQKRHPRIRRKPGQSIVIGDTVIQIVKTSRGGVEFRVCSDTDVVVLRGELHRKLVACGERPAIGLEEFVT